MSHLGRRALAEALGTAFLVATVIGSGIAATRLSPGDVGAQLLANSLATAFVLVALILALGSVSAAFNPVVTLAQAVLEEVGWREVPALVAAQVAGACGGALLANVMFELPAVSIASRDRTGEGTLVAEVVATVGLLLVVFGAAHSASREGVALAVGGYIGAAYWFTSSTSFANPAVTVARTLSDSFAGIAPASAFSFVVAQLGAGVLAVLLVRLLREPA